MLKEPGLKEPGIQNITHLLLSNTWCVIAVFQGIFRAGRKSAQEFKQEMESRPEIKKYLKKLNSNV